MFCHWMCVQPPMRYTHVISADRFSSVCVSEFLCLFQRNSRRPRKKHSRCIKEEGRVGWGCGARSGSGNVDMNCQISGCTQRNLYRTRWCNRWASACGHCQIFGQSYIKIILFYHRRCHWKGRTAVKCVWQEKGEIWAAKQFPCLKMVFATRWGFWGRMEGY